MKELNKEQREEAIINIAKNFKQCDTYTKGYVAGVIDAVKAFQSGSNDAGTSMSSMQAGA